MANVRKSRYGRFLSEICTRSARSVCNSVKAVSGEKVSVCAGVSGCKGEHVRTNDIHNVKPSYIQGTCYKNKIYSTNQCLDCR